MYAIRALYEAHTVEEAIALLTEHPEAGILAGGSDVLIQIREGRLMDREWVSIYGIDSMRGIEETEEGLRIGSLTSFSHITRDPLIQKHIPVLGEAVDQVGGPQIRNIGTIGGNTCNGVTSADSASTLFAWEARVELSGPEGIRCLPISDFYLGAGRVDLRPGELQTAILVNRSAYEGYFGHYIKYAMRNAMDIATLGCSVNVRLSEDRKQIEDCRIAYGVAGPIPLRARTAEQAAKGAWTQRESIREIAKTVLQDIRPRESWRAAKDFREHMAVAMAERALIQSIERAGGQVYAV